MLAPDAQPTEQRRTDGEDHEYDENRRESPVRRRGNTSQRQHRSEPAGPALHGKAISELPEQLPFRRWRVRREWCRG